MSKPLNVLQVYKALTSAHRFDMLETLKLTGWATNGRWMFRPGPEFTQKILNYHKGTDAAGRPLSPDHIKGSFPKGQTALANVQGEHTLDDTKLYRLTVSNRTINVNAQWYDTILKHCPHAKPHATNVKNTPVVFKQNDEIVALLMPWRE